MWKVVNLVVGFFGFIKETDLRLKIFAFAFIAIFFPIWSLFKATITTIIVAFRSVCHVVTPSIGNPMLSWTTLLNSLKALAIISTILLPILVGRIRRTAITTIIKAFLPC